MQFHRRHKTSEDVGDMTPMIDMVFLLIAFFTVVVNFTEAEQDERINLPSSELALPPEAPPETPITLQVLESGNVVFGGAVYEIAALEPQLQKERKFTESLPDADFRDSTIIIRADSEAKHGVVQEVIATAQNVGYEKFNLRAKSQESAFRSAPVLDE